MPCAALAAIVAMAGFWMPSQAQLDALPELMRVEEASSVWGRIALACLGWLHLRPLQLHFTGVQFAASPHTPLHPHPAAETFPPLSHTRLCQIVASAWVGVINIVVFHWLSWCSCGVARSAFLDPVCCCPAFICVGPHSTSLLRRVAPEAAAAAMHRYAVCSV
jgi:hypothetical protein